MHHWQESFNWSGSDKVFWGDTPYSSPLSPQAGMCFHRVGRLVVISPGASPNLTHVQSLPTCCVSSQTRGHGAVLGTGCSCRPASVLWLWGEGASFWPCEDMVWGYRERGRQGWKNNSVSRERGQDQVLGQIQLSQ